MLTAEQIEALGEQARAITEPITEFLLEDIARRVSEAGQLTSTASYQVWRLQNLGVSQKELKKELAVLSAGEHTFADFRLHYYSDQPDPKYGASPRSIMTRILALCRKYAAEFSLESGNLLFNGGTGLGKTLLSACIAREVAEKGFSVAYESAPHLFSKLEKARFHPDADTEQAVAALERCDLLIVDDLGTELPGSFVTAALYTLVNDRLLAGKPIIISTNLNMDEIRLRYSPQIASRLQGSFQLLPFVGEDIRIIKSK